MEKRKSLPADTDRVSIRGMVFHAYHGAGKEERALGQKFVVDLDLFADLREAGRKDQLSSTVDYSKVYKVVKKVVEGEKFSLLEALAEAIAATIRRQVPRIKGLTVRVRKSGLYLEGVLDCVEVEIHRAR